MSFDDFIKRGHFGPELRKGLEIWYQGEGFGCAVKIGFNELQETFWRFIDGVHILIIDMGANMEKWNQDSRANQIS